MSNNFYKNLAILDSNIGLTLNNMPSSSYEDVDIKKELPLFSFLPSDEYEVLKEKVLKLRCEIIEIYVEGDEELRNLMRYKIHEYGNFNMVFTPNKDFIEFVEDKKDYLLNILVTLSIQNLNDDIRELIIYLNELRRLSLLNHINFDSLSKEVIPLSSSIPTIYTISMREFFENVLHKKPNPINANDDHK